MQPQLIALEVSRRHLLVVMLCLLVLSACAGTRTLIPTPTIYSTNKEVLFENLAPELQGNQVDLLYATDRVAETDKDGVLSYNAHRSISLAFGSAKLLIGSEPDWNKVVPSEHQAIGVKKPTVVLASLTEIGRFPGTPYRFDENYKTVPEVLHAVSRENKQLAQEIHRRLAVTSKKDVFLFVHGVDNTFEFALQTWASMWHFLGREGVPIVYSWPAGYGGNPLTGYTYDRESGEFTIFHLKEFIKALAANPEIERIHLLAHSRGTDVLTSAIRELFIEARAAHMDIAKHYKIANLVLVAPDMDMDIVSQRLAAEKLSQGIKNITIYVSSKDKALGMASFLFSSMLRFGQIQSTDIPNELKLNKHITNLAFIDAGRTKGLGHDYFYENPSVSSDILLLLRYSYPVGSKERPLEKVRDRFWKVPNHYLK